METARNEAHAAIQEPKKITMGKAFKMQSKYAEKQYLLLTRVWSSPGAFANLPHSVSDAVEFYRAEGGGSSERLFWSQYAAPEHPVSFTEQLKQLVELHRVAELAIKDLIIWLWPAEAMPGSYFGLMRWMMNAVLGWTSSSAQPVLKVHAWPSPVARCGGRTWTLPR